MKMYGRKKEHYGCCPGHDTYPSERYSSRRSDKARSRDNKQCHRRGRRTDKMQLQQEVNNQFLEELAELA